MISKGQDPQFREAPWFYRATQQRLRQEYPGVPPWAWDAHPEWLDRVIATLNAEDDAYAALNPRKPK